MIIQNYIFIAVSLTLSATIFLPEQYVNASQKDDNFSWQVSGDVSTRIEFIDIRGDAENATLNDDGNQYYSNINLLTTRQISNYERLEGSLAAVANNSSFRQESEDLILERFSVKWEKSDRQIPFRLHLGDYYGYVSHRTLQRNLKGAQFEIQTGDANRRQSVQWFLGNPQADYQDFDLNENLFYGASWLLENRSGLSLNANIISNRMEVGIDVDDEDTTSFTRSQRVMSFGAHYRNQWLNQQLEYEGEFAYLDRDDPDSNERSVNDSGFYASIKGQDQRGFDYGIRFDRYGEGFQPAGAVVTANRQSILTHLNWRQSNGKHWRFRIQEYTDALDSEDPIETQLFGVDYQSKINKANVNIQSFFQNVKSYTINMDSYSVSNNVSIPINLSTNAHVTFNAQRSDDHLNDLRNRRHQAGVSVNRRIDIAGQSLATNFGANYQKNNTGVSNNSSNLSPTLGVNWNYRQHQLSMNYNSQQQRFLNESNLNRVRSQRLALRYNFNKGPHKLGLEWSEDDRFDESSDTATKRLAINYNFSFGHKKYQDRTAGASNDVSIEDYNFVGLSIAGLPLGVDMPEVLSQLEQDGVEVANLQSAFLSSDVRVIPDLNERQQLVLEHNRVNQLHRAVLIIKLPSQSGVSALSDDQAFSEVLNYFINILGSPTNTRRNRNNQLVIDDSNFLFAQNYQWELSRGRELRLGLPQRLDGRLQIEAHFAFSMDLGLLENQRWGLDEFIQ